MRQNAYHWVVLRRHVARLLTGILLFAAPWPQIGLADDPAYTGENRLGVTPMGPMTGSVPRYDNQRQIVPGPPVQPIISSRPQSWPGGSTSANGQPIAPGAAGVSPANPQQAPPGSPIELCESTEILARVGSESIFANEILGDVNSVLERYKDKASPDQLEMLRTKLMKERLMARIETKLVYLDVKQTIPADHMPDVEKQIVKYFDSTELPNMLKRSGAGSLTELDQKLRGLGSSLEREKKTFIEKTLTQQWVHQRVKRDEEITYDQMLKYYRDHIKEFEKPAQAKWEEIMVQFSKFPGKAEAYNAIAQLGNEVFYGAAFADVAKRGSQGATASDGGAQGWTTKGSLKYTQLDEAIFALPPGRLSPIIETEKGYHIVRVLERVESEVTPFLTAQVDIKEKIVQERINKQLQEYLSELEDKYPVWTKFDGDRRNLRMADRLKEVSR